MKVIKNVKRLTYIMCAVAIYSFIGGITYNVHEHFYPGTSQTFQPRQGHDGQANMSEVVGFFWPVVGTGWIGVEIGRAFWGVGMSMTDAIGEKND